MKKSISVNVICLLLLLTFSVPQVCFGEEKATDTDKNIPAEADKDISAEADSDTYKIGSGDVLEIITWKEPDFTRDVVVRLDGMVTFPLLDDIKAAGRTSVELKKEIEKRLKDYIADPLVTVIVKAAMSQKFYILGEISKTGEYQLIKDLTVLQAFALAGGFNEWASKNKIILLRRVGGEIKMISVKYKDIVKGKELSQDILIKANDTIIVP